MPAKFRQQDIVHRLNQPEVVGVVLEPVWDDQTESWNYRVQFGGLVTAVPETSLQGWKRSTTSWEKIRASEFSGIDHFRDTLTFHKVRTPTARVAHAYATTRTTFYPHQFKPLLKFLDGGGNGLLIADDVGLGKTIEAGYILRELDARKELERVLVLAPARLAPKWQRELSQRFGERFDVVKGRQFIELSNDLERGREVAPFRWISSFEGIRKKEVQEAIESANPTLDLLIVDEAHRLRNPGTLQHRAGRLLCDATDYRIFLTATPVQNSLEDLWNLLKLLSEDQFPDRDIFFSQISANQKILLCQKFLSQNPPEIRNAYQTLGDLGTSDNFSVPASKEFVESIFQRLQNERIDVNSLVELNSDVSQLNSLGHVVTRTRKSEAMPGCARRVASWIPVDFTVSEQRIYEDVEQLCRTSGNQEKMNSWGYQMATLMAYRATASCIPAAIQYFHEKLASKTLANLNPFDGGFEAGELADGSEKPPSNQDAISWFDSQRDTLTELVDLWVASGRVDSKFNELTRILQEIWDEDDHLGVPRRKVVIFSFFRKTLEYLHKSLRELRKPCVGSRMIHGLINIQDREQAIDDFLTRPEIDVLLTSEVGGEGIDLQKASVVLNYDLPWNPMVVEQRIGRVDRIGQEAERIVIVNFVVTGSIEEKILRRLLDKIGIFENSVGEIDPIIGDKIEELTRDAVSGVLNDEQLEQKLVQEERALAARSFAASQIKYDAEHLFTSDQVLLEEIDALIGERQIPGDTDLWRFVHRFLGEFYPGYLIPEEALSKVVRVTLSPKLGAEIEDASGDLGSEISNFGRKVAMGEVPLTFSREVAYRHIHVDLVHFDHPLIKFAVWKLASRFGNESFCLSLEHSTVLQRGYYGFAIRILEMEGPIKRNRLETVILDTQNGHSWADSGLTNTVLIEILERGKSADHNSFPSQQFDSIEKGLTTALESVRQTLENRERQIAIGRMQQRQAISIRLAEMKRKRANDQLLNMLDSGAKEFAIKMGRLKLEKAETEFEGIRSDKVGIGTVGVKSWTDIAVGYLQVGT